MRIKQKNIRIVIAVLFVVSFITLLIGGVNAAETPNPVIRVGLHYGTGSMDGLNLKNEVGTGFRFGYYEQNNQFVALGSTEQQAISIVLTKNVYYGSYNGYTSYHTALTSSSVAVGAYHLQIPYAYNSFEQAKANSASFADGFPAYIDGNFYTRIGNYLTRDEAIAAQIELEGKGIYTEIKGTSQYGANVVITGTNTILFQFDDLGKNTGLGVEANQTAGNEKYTTWSKNCLYYGGFRFERINGGKLTVVNILTLEDYIKGVVSTEMSNSWPIEALKAQAVASRSYFISLGSRHSSNHFDICNSTHCQAYTGQTRAGSNSNAAVDQTKGQVALYNGNVAQTYYYSSNGGASENVSAVWGSSQSLYPYLVGKIDIYESSLDLSNTWERSFSTSQIVSKVLSDQNVSGSIVSAQIDAYTDVGNPKTITFTDSTGESYTVSSAKVYSKLGLPSFRFGFSGDESTNSGHGNVTSSTDHSITVNGSEKVANTDGLYVISGDGNISRLGEDVYVISGSGTVSKLEPGQGENQNNTYGNSVAVVENGSITFIGRGWGHNIGMSQYGAYAMAQQGKNYVDILEFYYTGIDIGQM